MEKLLIVSSVFIFYAFYAIYLLRKEFEEFKEQDKKKYNEELKSILKFFVEDTRGDEPWVDADDEWFEQNKKK